ncbi:hypothetical protein KIS1582_1400 [Cytobacillus firmus]|uniref:Uncharacterized protein n=1 Tax=Cytobacillus firmus TaxID=1399 RepID=A0A800MYH9_CYTFI|nr:hypothetical protein KIS1582_1400 [Cytobacillus firmus]
MRKVSELFHKLIQKTTSLKHSFLLRAGRLFKSPRGKNF